MTHVLAIEEPDGGLLVFTSPMPWDARGPTVTLNGRTLTEGYAVLGTTQVRFDVPPGWGDVVGFFVSPT